MKTLLIYLGSALLTLSFSNADRVEPPADNSKLALMEAERFVNDIRMEKEKAMREAWKSQTDLEAEFIKAKNVSND